MGPSVWTTLRRITIPLISPILLYNLVICVIATFQYFTQIYTLSNGNGDPNNATLFINLELFREAFWFSRMGYASAIAWLLFAIVLRVDAGAVLGGAESGLLRRGRPVTKVGTFPTERSFGERSSVARMYRSYLGQGLDARCSRCHRRGGIPAAAAVHGHDLVPAAIAGVRAGRPDHGRRHR